MSRMICLGPAGTGGEVLSGLTFIKDKGLSAAEIEFTHGVRMGIEKAKEVAVLNRKLGLRLSVHAPYFINLASKDRQKTLASRKRILDSCERAHHMGADHVVFHPGFLMSRNRQAVYELIKIEISELMGQVRKKKWNGVILAPETTGKISQFGDLDELLRMRKETGCGICIDFAHLYARHQGKIGFGEVCEKLKGLGHVHAHFSGIEFTEKGERRHVEMEREFFRPLAREIIDRNMDITIISESPVTWEDSLRMKEVFLELKPQSI